MKAKLKWTLTFAWFSLAVSMFVPVLDPWFSRGPGLVFMGVTAVVAALVGALAEGRRWVLRTLVAVPLGGAAYGTLLALLIPWRPYAFGAAFGVCASVLYLPVLLFAAWFAEHGSEQVQNWRRP
jgi:hypothetical protein